MTDIKDLLKNCFLFRGLPANALEGLKSTGSVKQFKPRQIIFLEGDPAEGFHIIMEGRVKIYKLSTEGREQILHIFGPDEPFGEAAVFARARFPANAMATETTTTFHIQRDKFVNLLKQDPSLAMNLLAVLSKRLMYFARMIGDLSLKEVPGRLATYLLILKNRQHPKDNSPIILDIPKTQLASLLGTIPETLSRIFSKMQKAGIIQVQGPEIKLLDVPALEELSGVIFHENPLDIE